MTTTNIKQTGHYEKPDDFLGGGGPREVKRPSIAKKKNLDTNKSGLDKPDFFLGGCSDEAAKGPKVKLRSSWLQPSDGNGADGQPPAPLLKSTPKPDDFLGGSVPDMNHHHDSDDETKNTKTTASSTASYQKPEEFHGSGTDDNAVSSPKAAEKPPLSPKKRMSMPADYHPTEFLGGSEPKPIKKWTPPKKQDSDKDMSGSKKNDLTWDHPQGFLGGSEPKPIKKWTPPPKQDAHIQSIDTHPSDFLGGSEPKEIKKWKPPKKEVAQRRATTNDITWDQPQGFLGGCEPKSIKKWTPPPKDQRVPAPWETKTTKVEKAAPRRNSYGSKNKLSNTARNNPRASWVTDTVNRNSMEDDSDPQNSGNKDVDDQELSMDQLALGHKEEKARHNQSGHSEPNFGYHDDAEEEEEHMSFNNSAKFEKVDMQSDPHIQSVDYHPSDFLGGSEPKPIKKWTPPKKQDSDKDMSSSKKNDLTWDHPQGFLGGSEPKPIKKWRPPPKEDAVPAPWEMSKGATDSSTRGGVKSDAHPDEFMGGCEPKPIKKWTPPPKQDYSDKLHKSHNDITWDHPNQFMGGCEPKPIRKWTPPPKEDAVPAPWEMGKGNANSGGSYEKPKSDAHPDEFLGGCEMEKVKKWKPVKKEDSDKRLHGSVNDITWDHPQQFLGGCEPPKIKKWTPPKK